MAGGTWNLQDAKAKLSELVDRAQSGKAQVILRRGSPAAVLVSIEEYERIRPRESLVSFLLNPPLDFDFEIPHSDEVYVPRTDLFDDLD